MAEAMAARAALPQPLRQFQRVVEGASPELLTRIRESEIELAIWSRQLPADLRRWLDALPPGVLPDGRLLAGLDDLEAAMAALLEESGTPAGPMRDAFAADAVDLARRFARIVNTDLVDIRLEAISHNGCWKFHRDSVEARLLTAYRGPGTQWVWPKDAQSALEGQGAFQGPVNAFAPHAVGLFKGSRSSSSAGIVHRSPPVAGSGITRLLLCLNLPTAASPEIWAR